MTVSVYKPRSHGDGNAVALFTQDSPAYREVGLVDENGNVVDRGVYVGRTNGGRPTYRFSRPGSAYGGRVAIAAGGQTYPIGNPGIRDENVGPAPLSALQGMGTGRSVRTGNATLQQLRQELAGKSPEEQRAYLKDALRRDPTLPP